MAGNLKEASSPHSHSINNYFSIPTSTTPPPSSSLSHCQSCTCSHLRTRRTPSTSASASFSSPRRSSSDQAPPSPFLFSPTRAQSQQGGTSRGSKMARGPNVFVGTIGLCALGILLIWWNRNTKEVVPVVQVKKPEGLCDPFAEPGFLHYDEERPKSARWIPFAEECDPSPDWLARFDARDMDSLSFLANRTILILGDSVDRNGLHHMAEMLGLPRSPVPYDDISKKGSVPEGWDERGIPWIVEVPWLNLTFTNGFMYGLDDEDNFRQQPDWHPPGLAEDRVDKLFKVHTDQLEYPPSFISLHSGLWDLAFFGRQDRIKKLSTEIPLTNERMVWWQNRMKRLIKHVQKTWPGVPVWERKLHRVGPVGGASYDWRHTGHTDNAAPEKFSNFFTDIRIHQIREMQEQVAINVGIPAFDFGEVWEGWQSHQDMVHPKKYPGGPAYIQGLIHHIWMEHVGREKWALTKERTLAPLVQMTPDSFVGEEER